jgi:hypothetical protein
MKPYLFLSIAVRTWAENYVLAGGLHVQIAGTVHWTWSAQSEPAHSHLN